MEEGVQYFGEQILQRPEMYVDVFEIAVRNVGSERFLEGSSQPYRGENLGFLGGRYSFFDGLWDGITLPFNAIGDLLNGAGDRTWARDGTGIVSNPSEDLYNIGYMIGAGGSGGTSAAGANSARNR